MCKHQQKSFETKKMTTQIIENQTNQQHNALKTTQGKWAPRNIPNPEFFEELNPYSKLKPFSRIGFELWTLSSDIYFDNIIITNNHLDAVELFGKVKYHTPVTSL